MARSDEGFMVGLLEGGVAYFDGNEWQIFPVDPDHPEAGVNDLHVTGQGELLAVAERGGLRFNWEAAMWEVIPQLDGFAANAILEDSDGQLWFAGVGGVYRFDPGLGDWEFTEAGGDELPAWNVTDAVVDEAGVVWFGLAGSGLSRLEAGEWQVWSIGEGPAGNNIASLVEDGDGNIWATLDDGLGVIRYTPADGTWQTFTEADGALDWPGPVGLDRQGRVWIGGWASARFFDGGAWRLFQNDALGEVQAWAISQDEAGAMWFGTERGIVRLDAGDGSAQAFSADDGLPAGGAFYLLPLGNSLVLANVDNKLMAFDGSGWERLFPDQDEVYQIAGGPSGEAWVAGGEWIFVYDGNTWEAIAVPEGWVDRLAVGPDGAVWAGGGDGLARFDPAQGSWEYLAPGDGLLSNHVQALLVARDGAVWVGTDGGLGRYREGQ
jgi:ligand-binding sensor domain-containing protein